MKEIIVYFKGAAKVTISNYEYTVLHSADFEARDRVKLDIDSRVAAGATEHATISCLSYICKDDGEGECHFD